MGRCFACEAELKQRDPALSQAIETARFLATETGNWVAIYRFMGHYLFTDFEDAINNKKDIVQVITIVK